MYISHIYRCSDRQRSLVASWCQCPVVAHISTQQTGIHIFRDIARTYTIHISIYMHYMCLDSMGERRVGSASASCRMQNIKNFSRSSTTTSPWGTLFLPLSSFLIVSILRSPYLSLTLPHSLTLLFFDTCSLFILGLAICLDLLKNVLRIYWVQVFSKAQYRRVIPLQFSRHLCSLVLYIIYQLWHFHLAVPFVCFSIRHNMSKIFLHLYSARSTQHTLCPTFTIHFVSIEI